jgi:hypothetical protein
MPASITLYRFLGILRTALGRKSLTWSYEREYRAHIDLPKCDEDGRHLFTFIPENFLKRVILGMRCETPVEEVEQALQAGEFKNIPVVRARLSDTAYEFFLNQHKLAPMSNNHESQPLGQWIDETDPFLEQEPCPSCKCKGRTQKDVQQPCPTCKGQGCVVTPAAQLKICPDCKGVCTVSIIDSVSCKECEGLGTLVFLSRNQHRISICDSCNSSGVVEMVKSEELTCPKCKGSGLGEKNVISTKQWIAIKDNKKKRQNFHERSGYSRPCSSCGSSPDPSCDQCDGIGRVVVVFPICYKCQGLSRIIKETRKKLACRICGGLGTTTEQRVLRARKFASKLPKFDKS